MNQTYREKLLANAEHIKKNRKQNVTNGQFIGLGGLLRSGKDTVADYLVEKHGWIKMGMSEPLFDMLMVLNPLVPATSENAGEIATRKNQSLPTHVYVSDLYTALDHDYTELKTNPEVRRLLQVLGTEVGREMIDPDLWVNIARERVLRAMKGGNSVVLTGIRFPNELQMVQEIGSPLWVERPGLTTAGSHASEGSVTIDDFRLGIMNNGTLDDLYQAVENVLDIL